MSAPPLILGFVRPPVVAVLVLAAATLGFFLGNSVQRPQADIRTTRQPEGEYAALLQNIEDLRSEVLRVIQDLREREDRAKLTPAPLAEGVVLDTRDATQAALVLEEYVYRRDRRWWYHSLKRLLDAARANESKLGGFTEWRTMLEYAHADLQAVSDADSLEAWINKYRKTLGTMPAVLEVSNLWRDWESLRSGR